MRDLAKRSKSTDLEPVPVVYGSTPHNPSTWDADQVHGCIDDFYGYVDGYHNISYYEGLFLSRQRCPSTHNKRLLDALYGSSNYTFLREVQELRCTARSGSFSLLFRGVPTGRIYANSTLAALRRSLLETHMTGDLYLESSDGVDSVCDHLVPRIINITFLSELTDVPLITSTYLNLSGSSPEVYIRRAIPGQGGLFECGAHGECDETTGQCQCWSNWGSSDGLGNAGTFGDCGFDLVV